MIDPNERFAGSFEFGAVEFGVEGFAPAFPFADVSGTYRLVFLEVVHLNDPSQYPEGALLPESARVSNAFEIVMP